MIGARFVGKPKIGAKESGSQFGNEFLGGVGFISEPSVKLAVQPMRCAAPVNAFMTQRGVIGGGVAKDFEVGELNEVSLGIVKGAVSAVPDLRAQRGEEILGI